MAAFLVVVRVLFLAVQALALAWIGYTLLTAFAGWRVPAPPAGGTRRRVRVVVPAHDEGRVIGGLLRDLQAQTHEHLRRVVIADRCADDTVAVARHNGADVVERSAGEPGKGPAIQDHLDDEPLEDDEVLLILDADNRVDPSLVADVAAAVDAGDEVVQAYLDVTSPDAGVLVTASALTYWAGNRMVQLARSNLGWSADLGGTGTALTGRALRAVGGFSGSLTEDQDLGVRLVLAGYRCRWLHTARVRDEKPQDLGVAVRQRARWVVGRRAAARTYVGRLLREAVAQRSWAPVDVAFRLLQPGRSFVALLSGVTAVAATLWPGPWLIPAPVWWAAVVAQFTLPPVFLLRDGVPVRFVLRYPLITVIAALWLPIRIVSRTSGAGWFHTPHRGDQ